MRYIRALGRLPGYVFYPIKKNIAFFVFMFVLGHTCSQIETPRLSGLSDFELFLDLYVVCLLLAALPGKIRWWTRAVLYAVLYVTSIVDVYCFVRFGSPFTPTMLLLIGETNGSEASEFVSSYLSWNLVTSDLGQILLIILLHIIYNVLMALARRTRHRHGSCLALARRVSVVALPVLGLLTVYFIERAVELRGKNKEAFVRLMSYDNIGEVEHELTREDKADLYLPVYRFAFSVYANRLAARQIDKLIEAKDRVVVDSCSFRSRNIVLIIGESYNRRHSQLYGYDKPTTPRQSRRAADGSLVAFTDVVTPWNLTSFVFKHVFSLYAVGDSGEWCDYPLFPEVFRKAGYRVTFLTNQFLPQAKEAVYDFSGGFFLNNPVLDKAQFDIRNTRLHDYDEGLLADYDSLVSSGRLTFGGPRDNNLIIVHLKGQHTSYRDRAPQKHKIFGPDDYDIPTLNRHDRWVLADYDNATLYNDSVVDAVVSRFEDKDAVVIYMPDHGEECFGGGRPIYGRLHSARIDYRLASEEFEIPFWIWCSGKYRESHPDVAGAVRAARNRPFMTDNVPHLLLYLAGISCPEYRDDYNLISGGYNEARPRVLKNTTDYNKLTPEDGE